jgi:hypothetical protein
MQMNALAPRLRPFDALAAARLAISVGQFGRLGINPMDSWTPMLVLPNLDVRDAVGCEFAAIVSAADSRVEQLCKDHPTLTRFLRKFSGQFGEQRSPSLLILRADAPDTCRTAEAVTAFRDLVSLSAIPIARARRLRFDRGEPFAYSTAFQFYPWTLDSKYEDVIMTNPASLSVHLLSKFNGQSFPEQSQASLAERDIDTPLARALLERWVTRFPHASTAWNDRVLFRSLNMANEAARIPALVASTLYDTGRTLALWVSAFEIVAHPGGAGQSNFATVVDLIEKVKWLDPALGSSTHNVVVRKMTSSRPLATWLCRKIYDLRNDYLHGNEVAGPSLMLNNKPVIDFAACLYRLVLTGFLDLKFSEPTPPASDAKAMARYIWQRRDFREPQKSIEEAILTAI